MYRWLLRLYPASFRNEYGREMAAVFARERRDTRTALGMAALWLRVIADTCRYGGAPVHLSNTSVTSETGSICSREPRWRTTACASAMKCETSLGWRTT